MVAKDKNPRRVRREVISRFEQGFDFERLDYDRRVKPLRGKAVMQGVLLAAVVYLAGFSLGYYGWQQQSVDYELFAKLVWILMVPATVVGAFAWLVTSNRLEFTLREDIRLYIAEREADGGFMWRFGPLYAALLPDNMIAQRLLEQSGDDFQLIDPEDYARSLYLLRQQLQLEGQHAFSTEVATQAYQNLRNL
jgi:hypothetical protein